MYCSGCRVVWPVFGAFCCISFQGMPLLRFVASCVFGEIKFFSFRKTRFGVRREADWSFLFSPFRYYIFSLLNPKWKQSIEQHYLRSQVTPNAEVYHIYREANHVPILVIIQSFPDCLGQFLLYHAGGVKFPEAGCCYEQITTAQERLDFTVQAINWEDHANPPTLSDKLQKQSQTLSTDY